MIILFPLWQWWFQFDWASRPFTNSWKFYKYIFSEFRHLFVSTFENSWLFCFRSDNDDSNLIGLLVHSLIVENFINIYFLKNNGTMWQTVHLRFTYFTLFDLTILTFIFCPNIILWVDVKITLLSIQSSLTLLRLFTAEEKSWLSLLF